MNDHHLNMLKEVADSRREDLLRQAGNVHLLRQSERNDHRRALRFDFSRLNVRPLEMSKVAWWLPAGVAIGFLFNVIVTP